MNHSCLVRNQSEKLTGRKENTWTTTKVTPTTFVGKDAVYICCLEILSTNTDKVIDEQQLTKRPSHKRRMWLEIWRKTTKRLRNCLSLLDEALVVRLHLDTSTFSRTLSTATNSHWLAWEQKAFFWKSHPPCTAQIFNRLRKGVVWSSFLIGS